MLNTLTENPTVVDVFFTPSGSQKQLQLNQSLLWTSRGEFKLLMMELSVIMKAIATMQIANEC
ncbi:MAG: hypothetical protein AB8W78_02200 [Arsenophonus endosymbiont of Dermacentor nuttalli]